MLPIGQVAAQAGIQEELLEYYGRYKAKIDITPLREMPRKGKLITPPSPASKEEKTASSIDPSAYEQGGRPVVDTDANKTTTATGTSDDDPAANPRPSTEQWTPPTGDLPM